MANKKNILVKVGRVIKCLVIISIGFFAIPVSAHHSDHALRGRRGAGHQGSPCGYTTGAFGCCASEVSSVRSQMIQVRRLDNRMSLDTEAIAALLVGHEEDDIWSIGWHESAFFYLGLIIPVENLICAHLLYYSRI